MQGRVAGGGGRPGRRLRGFPHPGVPAGRRRQALRFSPSAEERPCRAVLQPAAEGRGGLHVTGRCLLGSPVLPGHLRCMVAPRSCRILVRTMVLALCCPCLPGGCHVRAPFRLAVALAMQWRRRGTWTTAAGLGPHGGQPTQEGSALCFGTGPLLPALRLCCVGLPPDRFTGAAGVGRCHRHRLAPCLGHLHACPGTLLGSGGPQQSSRCGSAS
mmetsp:Transcript_40521/g.115695  ORF Transcript_40521/g.115695 Transcript_40521/m.115695 type:complete len:214 (-) Transcript_40521:250-891(-)